MSNIYKYDISQIKDLVKDDLLIVNQLLSSTISDSSSLTHDIANNIFSSGGKRIRPLLNILCAKLCSYHDNKIYYLAAAIELIHTATLLHDDVIDNSDIRRGNKTANNLYGSKATILVGDFLFAESFKYMVKTESINTLNVLANVSSIISEGEVKQLELKNKLNFDQKIYLDVIESKTAQLFGASSQSAAILAQRSSSECRILKDFGINLGMAFQIIDDILDYKSQLKSLGKNIGDDFFEQKITLPIILLFQKVDEHNKDKLRSIFSLEYKPDNNDLNFILSLLEDYKIYDHCYNFASQYINDSIKILKDFPCSKYRDMLESIAHIAIDRKF